MTGTRAQTSTVLMCDVRMADGCCLFAVVTVVGVCARARACVWGLARRPRVGVVRRVSVCLWYVYSLIVAGQPCGWPARRERTGVRPRFSSLCIFALLSRVHSRDEGAAKEPK
jgi:hypothetical protein